MAENLVLRARTPDSSSFPLGSRPATRLVVLRTGFGVSSILVQTTPSEVRRPAYAASGATIGTWAVGRDLRFVTWHPPHVFGGWWIVPASSYGARRAWSRRITRIPPCAQTPTDSIWAAPKSRPAVGPPSHSLLDRPRGLHAGSSLRPEAVLTRLDTLPVSVQRPLVKVPRNMSRSNRSWSSAAPWPGKSFSRHVWRYSPYSSVHVPRRHASAAGRACADVSVSKSLRTFLLRLGIRIGRGTSRSSGSPSETQLIRSSSSRLRFIPSLPSPAGPSRGSPPQRRSGKPTP